MKTSQTVTVVGCYAESEVGRVITGGVLPPPGDSLFELKRLNASFTHHKVEFSRPIA